MRVLRLTLSITAALIFISTSLPGQVCSDPTDLSTEPKGPAPDPVSWNGMDDGLYVSFASSGKRYQKHEVPTTEPVTTLCLKGWKGERIHTGALAWSRQGYENVTWSIGDLKCGDFVLDNSCASIKLVRYVITDEYGNGCGDREPGDYSSSLSPDLLVPISGCPIEHMTVRPLWITVDIPYDTPAGVYSGVIKFDTADKDVTQLQLALEVSERSMPADKFAGFHLDLWQHPSAVARAVGVELWSDEHFDHLWTVMKPLISAGQKVVTTTLNKDPWNVQCHDPYEDMIVWKQYPDGRWEYDYRVFDRWVSFMLNRGNIRYINCYSLLPWNNEVHYLDVASGKIVDVTARPGTDDFRYYWEPFLIDFTEHLYKQGWLGITNIAIDERTPEDMQAAMELLADVAPGMGVSLADNHQSYRKYPFIRDICVYMDHPADSADLAHRNEQDLITTFYVSCSKVRPNLFTFSEPREALYLGWHAWAMGYSGMLHWSYNSWPGDPVVDSRFRKYPSGDTFIIYPGGHSSVRFEKLIEGMQDFVKLGVILANQNINPEQVALVNELKKLLKDVSPEEGHYRFIDRIKEELF